MLIKSILYVGIGSFIGGVVRYIISYLMKNISCQTFPWETLIANLVGCFLIGIIFAIFSKYSNTNSPLYLLLATGFCGGFTTFSTFANESLQMIQSGNIFGFISYILTSTILGIALVWLGYITVK